MAAEKAQTLSKMRDTIKNEALSKPGNNRFGLFSSPPAGVWGDAIITKQSKKTWVQMEESRLLLERSTEVPVVQEKLNPHFYLKHRM